jgi:hypothetical protein
MTNFRAMCAELLEWAERTSSHYYKQADVIVRARALLAQPVPEVPTDEEIMELMPQEMRDHYRRVDRTLAGFDRDNAKAAGLVRIILSRHAVDHVRAALARWGRPTPQPVAVSERLPGAEDCALWPGDPEATPWCWAGKDIDGGWEWAQISMLGLDTDTLSWIIAGGGWTHWLPANALPTPEATHD